MNSNFTKIFTLAAIATVIGLPALNASPNPNVQQKIKALKSEVKPVREFRGDKPWGVSSFGKPTKHLTGTPTRNAVDQPSKQFEGLQSFNYLEGPDGSTWFYTAEYEKDYYEVSEWYVEELIKSFKFTIYNSDFEEVGTICDNIVLQPGESKVAFVDLDPSLSQFFFNNDENVEAMVYIAMNTGMEYGYEVHYYNIVYSIGGEKDENGNDKIIAMMPGRCIDSINASDGGEDFYYSFADDIYPDMDDYDFNDFVDYINNVKTSITVYGKGAENNPAIVLEKDIFMSAYPGDTTDGIYLITFSDKGEPYFVFSYYEKPYFIDPTGFATDESATPDNNLIIETYGNKNGEFVPVNLTKIEVETPVISDQLAYFFYSIGSVSWKNDIVTKVNGTVEAPGYVVARDYVLASQPDDQVPSYFLYGNDGKMIKPLMENADGLALLNSEYGDQPNVLFVTVNKSGLYVFNFVDLYSGETLFTLDQDNDGDPLTAVCQRIKGADGKYKYAFEMEYDDLDDNGNDVKRIAWYNADGTFDRFDRINMGKDVMYASVNMYPESLSPYLYDTDDAMEYAVLVKRAYGQTTRNEFLISDDNGENYALFTSEDGKGDPIIFTIIAGENDYLSMVYGDEKGYNVDIYNLPFVGEASVKDILADNGLNSIISQNGEYLLAPGCSIEIYSISGMKIAEGKDSISLKGMNKGVYVVKATGNNNRIQSLKIVL